MEESLYMEQFTLNSLPMNDRQLETILTITRLLKIDPDHGLILLMPNNDDPQEIRIRWIDDGYFVGMCYPMEEFGWSHPLLLGGEGLRYEDVEMLVTEICVNQTGTENIEIVMNDFRDMTAQVFEEKSDSETESQEDLRHKHVQEILHNMSDEEFFKLDPDDYTDYDYDEIKRWYAENPDRPVVNDFSFVPQPGQWDSWAEYLHEAACRDNPIALALFAYFSENGISCKKDLETAYKCYARGAELGEIHCLRALERIRNS